MEPAGDDEWLGDGLLSVPCVGVEDNEGVCVAPVKVCDIESVSEVLNEVTEIDFDAPE
jgi:hypothetical protein